MRPWANLPCVSSAEQLPQSQIDPTQRRICCHLGNVEETALRLAQRYKPPCFSTDVTAEEPLVCDSGTV